MSGEAEQLPCLSCGGRTEWRCSDCAINGTIAAVCADSACRDMHELDAGCTPTEAVSMEDVDKERAYAEHRKARSRVRN